jgi:hypothetical protein
MTPQEKVGGIIAGVASGFLRGMFGAGGPPMMVYVSLINMDKANVRALSNTVGIIVSPIAAVYILWFKEGWKWSHWPSYTIVVVFGVLGLGLGNWLYQFVSSQQVLRGVIGLLVLAAVVMLGPPLWVTIAVIVLEAALVLAVVLWSCWTKRRSMNQSSPPLNHENGATEDAEAPLAEDSLQLQDDMPLESIGSSETQS